MARDFGPLNERQVTVLRWIVDGCPAGVMDGDAYKVSAIALQSRGLARVSKRRGLWRAEATDDGRNYLLHGTYPDRAAPVRASPASSKLAASRPSTATGEISPDDLLSEVAQGNGILRVASPDAPTRERWRRAINRVKQTGRVPEGFHLRLQGRDEGDLVIELVAGEHPDAARWNGEHRRLDLREVVDPSDSLIAAIQAHPGLGHLSERCRYRAVRILASLADAAKKDGYPARVDADGPLGLTLRFDDHDLRFSLSEELDTKASFPAIEELEAATLYDWQRVRPRVTDGPSGRLVLELPRDWASSGKTRRWADRTRWTVEDKLAEALMEIEACGRALIDKARQEQLAKQRRQRDWERAIAEARMRYVEDHRQAFLDQVLAERDRAGRASAYCDALEQRANQEDDPAERDRILEWVAWARADMATRDPTARRPAVPLDLTPGPQDLRPYLKGFSPYGPESSM
ncbi:MAG: hypothetical protein ACRDZ8_17310 [Acidimicrobiales bacterium]